MLWIHIAALLGVGAAITSPAVPSGAITVGRNVQVSRARGGDAHNEVLVAADPVRPGRLLVGSILRLPGPASTIAYLSEDGGETWTPTLETPPTEHAIGTSSDPALAFAPDGTALFLSSLLPPNSSGPTRRMLLYRAPDGGRTWKPPVYFTYSDREYIVVDGTQGPNRGRIYVNGNSRVGATAGSFTTFYSSDAGESFTESRMPKLTTAREMGNAVVLADGTLVGLYTAARIEGPSKNTSESEAVIRVIRSVDGGRSFAEPIDVAPATLVAGRKGDHNNTLALPTLAVDASNSAFKDRLYAVWPDYRDGYTDIYLCVSKDGGLTWSAPARVNDAPKPRGPAAAVDHFMPTVAVNRDGVLGILWYDRRNRPDNMGWDARFTASRDGGLTFLPSVKVSEKGSTIGANEQWLVDSRVVTSSPREIGVELALETFTFLGGDTAGLAADVDGRFHPVWVENSTGIPQVWTAAVTVAPSSPAVPVTAPRGLDQRMRDVTDSVIIDTDEPIYDRASGIMTVSLHLRGKAERPLNGPLRLRLTSLRSELGEVSAIGTDRGGGGVGGEWDVSARAEGPDVHLQPITRTLSFRLTNLKPFRQGKHYERGLVSLRLSVLAPDPGTLQQKSGLSGNAVFDD